MPIKCAFISLGCPKNQCDSEVMLKKLVDDGIEIVPEDIDADVVVINTCAFIESAKKEAIDTILDVAWLKENRSLKGIVVTGCLVQRYKDELFKELPEIDAAIGVGDIEHITEAVRAAYESGESKAAPKYCYVSSPENQAFGGDRVVTTPSYMAYLKISEGCDNHCTYCIIPTLRGRFRSRPIEDLEKEARELCDLGVRELVIVSQDTTAYGKDLYGKPSLEKLLHALCGIDKLKWIRLLYTYPEDITESLARTIADEPKIVKYLDMPIQHIDDKVLKRMGRRGDSALIKEKIKLLRDTIPHLTLRSTVIVGFPGEGKEEFARLAQFLADVRFERLGVFAFSCEEGTPAEKITDGIVSESVKQKRLDTLMKNQYRIHAENNGKAVGSVIEVLCEGFDRPSGVYFGRSAADAPEIDGKVYFRAPRKIAEGDFVNVKVTDVIDYDLFGDVIL